MSDLRAEIHSWLFAEFSSHLATVFESMAGERPDVEWVATGKPPADDPLRWRQPFSGVPGTAWIAAGDQDWTAAGEHILRAAGVDELDAATVHSTNLETVRQALSVLAQTMSGRLGIEVACEGGEEAPTAAPAAPAPATAAPAVSGNDAACAEVRLKLGAATATLILGLDSSLTDAFVDAFATTQIDQSASESSAVTRPDAVPPVKQSQTLDLLLDVELPVSISFGRAQVPLKDVLKLITGSIVELNRSISEPVEVIVNNCVIARGEVVVVEGNFGVRIQQVISRQERLRSLN